MNPRWLRPRRWRPPVAPARAADRSSRTPMPAVRLVALPGDGPEDVVLDAAGLVLTGLADGRVVRVDVGSGTVETIADTGGRPLGLHACDDGSVLVCDSRRGLLRIDPDGAVDVLVDEVDGAPVNFASNVVEAPDGTIYFSTSTRRFDLEHYNGDIFEHSATGRLLRRSPSGEVVTLLDGLDFGNGVVLAPDGSCVVVAETGGYRITRYWLTGDRAGTDDVLIDNLPAFPDNMALGSDGLIWVGMVTPRNPLLDRLLPLPGWLRQLVWLTPDRLQPAPVGTAWVAAISFDGDVVHDLQTTVDGFTMVTSVIERDGTLYLGSLHGPAIAVTSVPR